MEAPSTVQSWFVFRHPVSGALHLAGAITAAVWAIVALPSVAESGEWTHVASLLIFCGALTALFSSSAAYHWLTLSPRNQLRLRKLDHSMIFVFIAASYTPVCLLALKGAWGANTLTAVWAGAALGVLLKFFYVGHSRWLQVTPYLLLSWVSVILVPKLLVVLSMGALGWLAAGGLCYSVGAFVYATRRPDPFPRVFGFHEVWHLMVLAGSGCHLWVVSHYLLGLG